MITSLEFRSLAFGLAVLAVTGCSASQPSNYYLLSTLPGPEAPIHASFSDQLAVGIGPVTLPAYLDRPQLVTRASANRLDLSEFERWAEPLQDMVSQTLAENLSALVGTDLVYALPRRHIPKLDYVVAVEVMRFEKSDAGQVELLARWSVLTGDENETLAARKSLIAERVSQGSDAEETVVAMSRAIESLSREIARDLQGVAGRMPMASYDLRVIQDALEATGYQPGPTDGVLGPRTRTAIRRFQGDHGIQETGEPSAQLQDMLMARP